MSAEKVWNMIEGFANYGFNKSHAISYAMISYAMARIWGNHRDEYLEWVINNTTGDKRKTALETCKKLGMKLTFPDYRNITQTKEYTIKDKQIIVPINMEFESFECLSEFVFGPLTSIQKSNLVFKGLFDIITPDRVGLGELVASTKNTPFPDTNDLGQLLKYGELAGLWTMNEDNNKFVLDIKKIRKNKEVIIYKNRLSLPKNRLEANIAYDLKNFGLVKRGTLSQFPDINLKKLHSLYNKNKILLLEKENHSPSIQLKRLCEKYLPFDEIAKLKEENFLVYFKENKNSSYGYTKCTMEFEHGSEIFWVREKELREKLNKINKNTVQSISLMFDWYINKNLDFCHLYKLKEVH